MNSHQVQQWMETTLSLIKENETTLSELDQTIGDGDHGVNMVRGFQAVVDEFPNWEQENTSAVMQKIGTTLVSKVGGASGPLFGTGFMRLGAAFKSEEGAWADGLTKAAEGIAQRGKVSVGDATLLDVWDPVAKVVQAKGTDWAEVERAAQDGMNGTKQLETKRGRGALLKERSIGHLDPGAVSSYYLFHALVQTMTKGEN
ncbi:dihydroxyacetone kinase subunit DhaL [Geomicrobium sediminis]|uniref:Dihydroxyacetone kinase-like protein n=1 Tax=Geomicrobium sediminis TaxID=1347788 RepID=A0ABS2PCV9_9BACL|nr:dihydroxyacetone kinase-like protein [Geomicrobium sediminis]